ncbi:MAG: Rho-binding antiterminator [Burkholderiales bacterium]|nr:Rho-binding antiterminator [Burkholderiales bacterium]
MDYQPIACMQHERLEFAVLRRTPLHLKLEDGRELTGLALDVFTQDGAEWLKFRVVSDVEETLRLDRIAAFSEL